MPRLSWWIIRIVGSILIFCSGCGWLGEDCCDSIPDRIVVFMMLHADRNILILDYNINLLFEHLFLISRLTFIKNILFIYWLVYIIMLQSNTVQWDHQSVYLYSYSIECIEYKLLLFREGSYNWTWGYLYNNALELN